MIKLIKSPFFKEKRTKQALISFIRTTHQLSLGDECAAFEREFARWQGRKFCVMFNSGSSANLALIQSLCNLELLAKRDRVGFSAISWSTNVMPLIQHSLIPIPVDVEVASLNVSPHTLLTALRRTRLKALFLTNLLGFSDDIASIKKICAERNILLIEDTCEALGSEYQGEKLGNFGLASTFSFFAGHHMSTIEGGAVCTDNQELYHALLMVRSHGWDRHLRKTVQSRLRKKHSIDNFYAKYTFYDLAHNIRPTEINGFLGRHQLQYLDEIVARREKNFEQLQKIYDNPLFERLAPPMSRNSNFAFPVICKNEATRKKYLRKSHLGNIEVRPIVGGLMTTQPFYKKHGPAHVAPLPNAEYIQNNSFYFANNPELTKKEIGILLKIFS